MGARMRVFLTAEQDRTLFELRGATTVPQRVKDRAEVLRLNNRGWYVEQIAAHFNWHVETVRDTLKRWQKDGLGGLWDAPRPGAQKRWEEADLQHLEACLKAEARTYNSPQLAEKLAQERGVSLSADRLRRVLKKRGSIGSAPDRAIEGNKMPSKGSASKPI